MTKQLNKKGTSLVELIAVIVIMGIIAGIAIPTTIAVINRQKRNAAVSSAQVVYDAAKNLLIEKAGNPDASIGGVTAYPTSGTRSGWQTSAAALLSAGEIDKNPFESGDTGLTIYYSDTDQKIYVTITSGTALKVNGVTLNFNSSTGKFVSTTNETSAVVTS